MRVGDYYNTCVIFHYNLHAIYIVYLEYADIDDATGNDFSFDYYSELRWNLNILIFKIEI